MSEMQSLCRINDPCHDIAAQRWAEMKTDRAAHETDWDDITRLMGVKRVNYSGDTQREQAAEKPLSSGPFMARSNFAAGLYGTLTNPANRWFGFRTNDPALNNHQPARLWMDAVTDRAYAYAGSTQPNSG